MFYIAVMPPVVYVAFLATLTAVVLWHYALAGGLRAAWFLSVLVLFGLIAAGLGLAALGFTAAYSISPAACYTGIFGTPVLLVLLGVSVVFLALFWRRFSAVGFGLHIATLALQAVALLAVMRSALLCTV